MFRGKHTNQMRGQAAKTPPQAAFPSDLPFYERKRGAKTDYWSLPARAPSNGHEDTCAKAFEVEREFLRSQGTLFDAYNETKRREREWKGQDLIEQLKKEKIAQRAAEEKGQTIRDPRDYKLGPEASTADALQAIREAQNVRRRDRLLVNRRPHSAHSIRDTHPPNSMLGVPAAPSRSGSTGVDARHYRYKSDTGPDALFSDEDNFCAEHGMKLSMAGVVANNNSGNNNSVGGGSVGSGGTPTKEQTEEQANWSSNYAWFGWGDDGFKTRQLYQKKRKWQHYDMEKRNNKTVVQGMSKFQKQYLRPNMREEKQKVSDIMDMWADRATELGLVSEHMHLLPIHPNAMFDPPRLLKLASMEFCVPGRTFYQRPLFMVPTPYDYQHAYPGNERPQRPNDLKLHK